MRISSHKSTTRTSSVDAEPSALIRVRAPSRERGRQRVDALLVAAAQVFDQKGFDAATMTAIASEAGASIGSLYQFFKTKEAIAGELLRLQTEDLLAALELLSSQAAEMSAEELGDALCFALIEFRGAHPSFARLVETSTVSPALAEEARRQIRARISAILRAHAPGLSPARADLLAIVTQQLMKAAVQLHGEFGNASRNEPLHELAGLVRRLVSSAADEPESP